MVPMRASAAPRCARAPPSTTEATTKRWSGRAHRGAYADAQDAERAPRRAPASQKMCSTRLTRQSVSAAPAQGSVKPPPGRRCGACATSAPYTHRYGTRASSGSARLDTPHCKHATSPPEPVSLRPGRSRSKHQSHVIDVIGPPPPSGEYWMKRQHVGAVERGFRHRARFSRRTRFVGEKCSPRVGLAGGVGGQKKRGRVVDCASHGASSEGQRVCPLSGMCRPGNGSYACLSGDGPGEGLSGFPALSNWITALIRPPPLSPSKPTRPFTTFQSPRCFTPGGVTVKLIVRVPSGQRNVPHHRLDRGLPRPHRRSSPRRRRASRRGWTRKEPRPSSRPPR